MMGLNAISGVLQSGVKRGRKITQPMPQPARPDQFIRFGNTEPSAPQPAPEPASAPSPQTDNASNDIEIRIALDTARDEAEIIAALQRAGDQASGVLTEKIQRFLAPKYSENIRFNAADAIVGLANRGDAKGVDAYIQLINYGDATSEQDSQIRQLALRSFYDDDLQFALASQNKIFSYLSAVNSALKPLEPMNLPPVLFKELALRTLAQPVSGKTGTELMKSLLTTLTQTPQAGVRDQIHQLWVGILNGSEKASLALIQQLNILKPSSYFPKSDWRARDVLPLIVEPKLTQIWRQAPYKVSVQTALKAGLKTPVMLSQPDNDRIRVFSQYLTPEELKHNTFSTIALARLDGKSGYTGLDEAAMRYMQPTAVEDNDFYGLTQLEDLLNECEYQEYLTPLDAEAYREEQRQRIQNMTSFSEMSWELGNLQDAESGRYRNLISNFSLQLANPGAVKTMFKPGFLLGQRDATYIKSQLIQNLATTGNDDVAEELAPLFFHREIPLIQSFSVVPAPSQFRFLLSDPTTSRWQRNEAAQMVNASRNLAQSLANYQGIQRQAVQALSQLALKTDALGRFSNVKSIELLGKLVTFDNPAVKRLAETYLDNDATRFPMLSALQHIAPANAPASDVYKLRQTAINTLKQIDFAQVPNGEALKTRIKNQLQQYLANCATGQEIQESPALVSQAAQLYNRLGIDDAEKPTFIAQVGTLQQHYPDLAQDAQLAALLGSELVKD